MSRKRQIVSSTSFRINTPYKDLLLGYFKKLYASSREELQKYKFEYLSLTDGERAKFERSITSDQNNDIYFYLDQYGLKRFIIQVGKSFSSLPQPSRVRCDWCFRDYEVTETQPLLGIPTRIDINPSTRQRTITSRGKFCHDRCRLAKAYFLSKQTGAFRVSLSLRLIHEDYAYRFRLANPGREPPPLTPAPLPELAKWNGGPLDETTFFGDYRCIPQPAGVKIDHEIVCYELCRTI